MSAPERRALLQYAILRRLSAIDDSSTSGTLESFVGSRREDSRRSDRRAAIAKRYRSVEDRLDAWILRGGAVVYRPSARFLLLRALSVAFDENVIQSGCLTTDEAIAHVLIGEFDRYLLGETTEPRRTIYGRLARPRTPKKNDGTTRGRMP